MIDKQTQRCPKCGCVTTPADAQECVDCGIVFSKFKAARKKLLMSCKVCQKEISKNAAFCPHCGEIYNGQSSNSQIAKKAIERSNYAGFWFRVIATVVDGFIVQLASIVVIFPLFFALGASMSRTSTATEIEIAGQSLGFVMGILINWLYFTLLESSKWQATLVPYILILAQKNKNLMKGTWVAGFPR